MWMYDADRGDVQKGSAEIFFRKVKFWKEDGEEEAPPVFVWIFSFSNVDDYRTSSIRLKAI